MSLGQALESLKDTESMVFVQNVISRSLPRGKHEQFKQHFDTILAEVYRAGCGDTVDEVMDPRGPETTESRSQPDESPNKPGAAGPALYDHDTSLEI